MARLFVGFFVASSIVVLGCQNTGGGGPNSPAPYGTPAPYGPARCARAPGAPPATVSPPGPYGQRSRLRPAPARLSPAAARLSAPARLPAAAWLSAPAGRSSRRSWPRACDGRDGRPRPRSLPLRQRLRLRSRPLQHAERAGRQALQQVRVPLRRRERRLHLGRRLPRGLLRPQAAGQLKPSPQYVVTNESIFAFAGHERPRTARSTHDATPAFGGFV